MGREVRLLDVKESGSVVVRATVRDDVVRCQTTLAPGRDEHDDRLVGRILKDREVRRLGHCDHERWEVGDLEALYMNVHV